MPTAPKPPASGITLTGGSDTGTTRTAVDNTVPTTSGLASLLPGLANALAAEPIGGVRGPTTAPEARQVVLLNLSAPTYAAIDVSGGIQSISTVGGTEDDVSSFFSRIALTMNRLAQITLAASTALFGNETPVHPGDALGQEEQEPQLVPDDPDCGANDLFQEKDLLTVQLAAINPWNEGVAAPRDAQAAIDGVWTLALGFAGGFALLGRTDGDQEGRRLALALRMPRDA